MDKPIIEVTIAAPVDTVWQALRDKEQLRRWHGWEYEESGGLDRELDEIYFTDETEDAAAHRLELQGGDVFTLEEAAGGGTRLRVVRAAKGASPEWEDYYDDITQGWISFTQQLKFALERQPGKDRRTLFFSATGKPPVEALGLTGLADVEVGKRYDAELGRASIGGEVWFRTEEQLGLTVEQWGDGLLVLAYVPAKSAAMAILTTYGRSDADLATLRDTWSPEWSNHYPA